MKGGMCYIVAVWRGHFLPLASAEITNVKFKTHGLDIISPIMKWMVPDEVEPKRPTLKDPEANLYQCIFVFSYMSVFRSDVLIQDDIGFKKTMQMSSYGGHSYKFNAVYVDRSFEDVLQTGYIDTQDEQKRIVLEVKPC